MLNNRHIPYLTWLLGSMMMLMLTACSASDEENMSGSNVEQKKSATLAVYVYAPEPAAGTQKNAVRRRADVGNVDVSSTAEGEIKSLQLWIYESTSGNYVGYLKTTEVASLNTGEGALYQIPVSDEFAASKPAVDVFVHANVTTNNCGVGTLNENTIRTDLMTGAKIATNYFGLSNLQTSVPTDGLPMAGKLTVQPVVGEAPALRVGDMNQVSTVQLTRAVSKLRFVFSKTAGQPPVSITSIKINADMIPNEEYLFKTPESMNYNTEAKELFVDKGIDGLDDIDDIAETADPTDFLYLGQEAQEYENLINEAASKATPEVTVEGPIYLRESDKQLAGTISYKIDDGDEQTVDFAMQQAGDFLRNHTWIVYAYYAGSGKLQVQSLFVKDWSTREMNHSLYNW